MKDFKTALRDGFNHIKEITDPNLLKQLRNEGVRVDDEGLHEFPFGDHKEYTLRVEPIGDEGHWQVALYKNEVLINEKLRFKEDEEKN